MKKADLVVLDTGVILDRIKGKLNIRENITVVSVIECPPLLRSPGLRAMCTTQDWKTSNYHIRFSRRVLEETRKKKEVAQFTGMRLE